MSSKAQKVNWEDVKKKLPSKPDTWKCKDLCIFLEDYGLKAVVEAFKANALDGNLFLTLEDDDPSWEDLELDNKCENLLKQYRNQLKDYNNAFSQKPPQKSGNPNINQIKSQLEGIKKGGIKIEESVLFMEPADQGKRNLDKSNKSKVKESPSQKKAKNEVDERDEEEDEEEEEQKKPEKKKDLKKQPAPSNDDDSDEGEKTMKRGPKKKEPEVKHDEEDDDDLENPKTIKRTNKKKVAPEIQLTQIGQKNVFTDFSFNQTFPINRQSKISYGISLHPEKEVSMNHVIVHHIEDSGFFLQDVGSSNSSFIKLNEKSNVTLKEGLMILMGESIFEVITLSNKKIELQVTIDFEADKPKKTDIEIKFNNNADEIVFGKNPSAANSFCFNKDKEIDDEHAKFKKFQGRFLFCPNKTVNNSWIVVGSIEAEKEASDLYLLRDEMEFILSRNTRNRFIVKKTFKAQLPICKCKTGHEITVALPCGHQLCTSKSKAKECDICGAAISSKKKLIDIFQFD